jgi:hypothetical protein
MPLVTVYDTPMCCSSGVCGPEIDPRLVQFSGDLDWLKRQGVEVRRFNLAQEPGRFVENAAVKALLDVPDGRGLPAVVIGDVVAASGRYPDRDELAALAGLVGVSPSSHDIGPEATPTLAVATPRDASSCCGGKTKPDSTGCC